MPGLRLRLTDEQHKLLADAAVANSRSLQREITHRLFATAGTAIERTRDDVVEALTGEGARLARPLSKQQQAGGRYDR